MEKTKLVLKDQHEKQCVPITATHEVFLRPCVQNIL